MSKKRNIIKYCGKQIPYTNNPDIASIIGDRVFIEYTSNEVKYNFNLFEHLTGEYKYSMMNENDVFTSDIKGFKISIVGTYEDNKLVPTNEMYMSCIADNKDCKQYAIKPEHTDYIIKQLF